MRRLVSFLFLCLFLSPAWASADVRTGQRDDPTDATLHQNVDGTSYRDPDIQKVAVSYDTSGSVRLDVTYLDVLPAGGTSADISINASEFSVSGPSCGSAVAGDATITYYPQRNQSASTAASVRLQGFEGTIAAETTVSPDQKTVTVTASAPTMAGRGYRCVSRTNTGYSYSGDSTSAFRLFGPGAYDQASLAACENEIDDDGDGKIDLSDRACSDQKGATEVSPVCDDGIDNDGDGKVDLIGTGTPPNYSNYDSECESRLDPSEGENPCTDLYDNDQDGNSQGGFVDGADVDSRDPAGQNCDQSRDRQNTLPIIKKVLTIATATAFAGQYVAAKYAGLEARGKPYLECPEEEFGSMFGGPGKAALCACQFDATDGRTRTGQFLVRIKANEFVATNASLGTFIKRMRTCKPLKDLKGERIAHRRLRAGGLVGCRTDGPASLIRDLHRTGAGRRTVSFHGTNRAGFEEQVRFRCKVKRRGSRYSASCANALDDRFSYKFTRVPKVKPKPKPKKPSRNCTAGYTGQCLTPKSDYDCAGGGGDGPGFVYGPVYITGSDPYDLDRDGDGLACEDS